LDWQCENKLSHPVKENHCFCCTKNIIFSKAPKTDKADLSKDRILSGRGIGSLNGENLVLYWADYHNEVAFLVPSPRESSEVSFNLGDDQSEDSKSGEHST
jgi:hypothetical protein